MKVTKRLLKKSSNDHEMRQKYDGDEFSPHCALLEYVIGNLLPYEGTPILKETTWRELIRRSHSESGEIVPANDEKSFYEKI